MLHHTKTEQNKKMKHSNAVLCLCVVYILRSDAISIQQGANNAFGDVWQKRFSPHFETLQLQFTP